MTLFKAIKRIRGIKDKKENISVDFPIATSGVDSKIITPNGIEMKE